MRRHIAFIFVLLVVVTSSQSPGFSATPIYVRADGHDTNCNGTANVADSPPVRPNCAVLTIQRGITLVDPGGTVIVAPGAYNESPRISKPLSLQSSGGYDSTVINLQNVPSCPTYLCSLMADATGSLTIAGFTINGFDAVGAGLASSNIVVSSLPSTVTIRDNRIRVGNIGGGTNGDDGFGILTYYSTTTSVDTLNVSNNIFEPLGATGRRAFYVNPGVNHFTFSTNQITGNFSGTAMTQAADGRVLGNTLSGVGAAGSRSAGLGTWGYPDPTTWGHTLFSGNTISGTRAAIAIYETNNVSATGNILSTNNYGVWVGTSVPLPFDVSTIHVNCNSITASDTAGVSNTVQAPLDAENNWWGCAAGPGNVGCDGVSGNVDYVPWAATPGAIVLVPAPPSVPADGSSTSIITATVTDMCGQPAPNGTVVSWGSSLGSLSGTTSPTSGGVATIFLTSCALPGEATVTAQATVVGNAISGSANVAFVGLPLSARRQKRYIVGGSLRPLAQTNLSGAMALKGNVESLMKGAEERGADYTTCQPFYEKGLQYLEEAQDFLNGNNAVAANVLALKAQDEFRKALECLILLSGNPSLPEA